MSCGSTQSAITSSSSESSRSCGRTAGLESRDVTGIGVRPEVAIEVLGGEGEPQPAGVGAVVAALAVHDHGRQLESWVQERRLKLSDPMVAQQSSITQTFACT